MILFSKSWEKNAKNPTKGISVEPWIVLKNNGYKYL